MAKTYTNRELDQMFKAGDLRADSFHEKLMVRMDDFEANTGGALRRIETQTTKTNGYVADLQKWKWVLVGFCACVTVLLIPTLLALVQAGKI